MQSAKSSKHLPVKLDNSNYYAWSYRMEMRLRKLGVWTIVSGEESRPPGSDNHKVVKGWRTRVDLALNEIIGEVGDSQLVHTRVSRDPSVVWERLRATHMSQGLGSIIATWQRFFLSKKADNVSVQAHAGSIREIADRLTGLGDGPSETLMVAVLLLSLPESYGSLVISLDSHPSNHNFDFVVQRCMNEEARQLMESSGKDSQSQAYHVDGKRPRKDRKDVTCYRCQKKGHYRNECQEEEGSTKKDAVATAAVVSEDSDSDNFAW